MFAACSRSVNSQPIHFKHPRSATKFNARSIRVVVAHPIHVKFFPHNTDRLQFVILHGWLIVKVAAYQAPLLPSGSMESLNLIRDQIARCEAEGVQILCCPEAVLGGLADYSDSPECFAISLDGGQLHKVLSLLASDTVTTIIGFTEVADAGRLFNAAAVCHKGAVLGVYRKLHPAMRQSVYVAGTEAPVFRIGHLTFGIAICLDSTFPDLARNMAASGATALFVPTNNGLPRERECADIPMLAKNTDISARSRTESM